MGQQPSNQSYNEAMQVCQIEGYGPLTELALDLMWTWNHSADEVWEKLDDHLWETTGNPWVVLQTVSREKLKSLIADEKFRKKIDELLARKREDMETPRWFQKTYPSSPLSSIAYFSLEFMLSEALPIYSGGLGNVAGDQLKAASDLGVPVVAVGLLYQQGYFRQVIDKNGAQQALYPYNDPGQLPITPLRKENGEWLRLEVSFPGFSLWLRTWQVQVGRVKLYLLDSNDPANFPVHRGLTSELYGGGPELRLQQEMILGIGGWRLLEAIGITPDVCHLNEGHAAFAVLERARSFMRVHKVPFHVALAATRSGNLFTTHTAVPAGFDRFEPGLFEQYMKRYADVALHIEFDELCALGRQNPHDHKEPFNMAYLAIRGSGAINGVSRLHGKVSQKLFEPLFPHWPRQDIPVGYVTNGIHVPTWTSVEAESLWRQVCSKERWLKETEVLEKQIRSVSDVDLWQMRNGLRRKLVEYTRGRLSRQLATTGFPIEAVEKAKNIFDPHTLTLGFARRFATYKRPNMLLSDPDRLLRILTNPQRPVQLIIAGKAHPADKPGQELIQRWTQFIRNTEARNHVVFLSDYDVLLTQHLVEGVDVWVNTPRRPWEACGTSGMKVLSNGGLNVSELDGWWAEAYNPKVGWAIGDGREHGEDPKWDAAEAEALYDLLEQEIVPEFYNRDAEGVPLAWIERIRESMATLTGQYSSNRSVRQYVEQYYLPAASAYQQRSADGGVGAIELLKWKEAVEKKWENIRFSGVKVETVDNQHQFEVLVYVNDLDPDYVNVQLYADGGDSDETVEVPMTRVRALAGDSSTYVYQASVPALRLASDYTPRVIPQYPGAKVPLEAINILWQH